MATMKAYKFELLAWGEDEEDAWQTFLEYGLTLPPSTRMPELDEKDEEEAQ